MQGGLKVNTHLSILFFVILFSWNNIQAQVSEEWFVTYNGPGDSVDIGSSIIVDEYNNVYVTGSSQGNGSGRDYTTIKYNSSGIQQWIQKYNGPGNSTDEAYDIAVDGSGNVYVTGRSRSTGSEYSYDYATVKYNFLGDQLWVARYNGQSGGPDEAYDIVFDYLDNVYVTGQSGYTQLNANIATIKYNSSGVQQWVAIYSGPGGDWDVGKSIVVDDLRNVYVAGGQNVDVGTAYHNYATIKYDSMGVQQWIATYNGPANNWDEVVSIGIDYAQNIYVTGYSTGTVYDITTIKYSSSGNQEWIRTYSSAGNSVDVPTSMVVDIAGNVYITGAVTFDFGTLKYNTNGDLLWIKRYDASGNFDAANSIAVDDDDNVYVTGKSCSGFLENTNDYATVKYNSSGDQQWVMRHNGTGNDWDEATSVDVDNAGNVYVTGYSSVNGSADIGTIKYARLVNVHQVSNEIPEEFELSQNYPNPFNPSTVITYKLAAPGNVSLKIYDVLGNEVAALINENQNAGQYSIEWNASSFSSGIYFYKIVTDSFTETKKMNLVK